MERHHIQIVADNDPGDASVELPHVDGTVHPAHLVHPQSRFDIGETAVDEIRNEEIDGNILVPVPVVIAHGRPDQSTSILSPGLWLMWLAKFLVPVNFP